MRHRAWPTRVVCGPPGCLTNLDRILARPVPCLPALPVARVRSRLWAYVTYGEVAAVWRTESTVVPRSARPRGRLNDNPWSRKSGKPRPCYPDATMSTPIDLLVPPAPHESSCLRLDAACPAPGKTAGSRLVDAERQHPPADRPIRRRR